MKNLKSLRKNLGLTQRELASKLDIPQANYGYYELGKANPPHELLIKMADFFGCSIDYLLGHETKGILHLDSFTPLQQEVIGYIQKLNDDQLNVVKGTLGTLAGVPLEDLLKKNNGEQP